MKYYLEGQMEYSTRETDDALYHLEHLFCTNGNGAGLDAKGYLCGTYYEDMSNELYDFGEPVPITNIYPWSENVDFQPFRKLTGCRNVGFKEAAQYFIDCLKISDGTVRDTKPKSLKTNSVGKVEFTEDDGYPDEYSIQDWKDNIDLITEVLINNPTISDEYSGTDDMSAFLSKFDDHEDIKLTDTTTAKEWYFDAQCGYWNDDKKWVHRVTEFIIDEVRHIWRDRELGNDRYIFSSNLDDDLFESYPNIYFWFKFKGAMKGDPVHVHWWW